MSVGEIQLVSEVVGILAGITAIATAYKSSSRFRFWAFDIWADLPFFGTIARRSRMVKPTRDEANARLDSLFRAYRLHILEPISERTFDNHRAYLFHAGDAKARPTPMYIRLFLLLLLAAEAFSFSFLLGLSISPNMSENVTEIMAIGIAFVLALGLLSLSHPAGHAIRRAYALNAATRESIDPTRPLPAGEKPLGDLTRRVQLKDDQDVDRPKIINSDAQRLINRVKTPGTNGGSYLLPVCFIIAILAIGLFQYKLRYASQMASALAMTSAGAGNSFDQAVPVWANGFFVLIFLMTQGLALWYGYHYGFLGEESRRAYEVIGGRNDYTDFKREYQAGVSRADESLASMYRKIRSRYFNVEPLKADYATRLKGEVKPQGGESDTPVPSKERRRSIGPRSSRAARSGGEAVEPHMRIVPNSPISASEEDKSPSGSTAA